MISVPLLVSPLQWLEEHPVSLQSLKTESLAMLLGPLPILGGAGLCKAVVFYKQTTASGFFIFHPAPFNHPAWTPLFRRTFPGVVVEPSFIPFEWPQREGESALTYELSFEFDSVEQFTLELLRTLNELLGTAEEATLLAAEEVAYSSIAQAGKN